MSEFSGVQIIYYVQSKGLQESEHDDESPKPVLKPYRLIANRRIEHAIKKIEN